MNDTNIFLAKEFVLCILGSRDGHGHSAGRHTVNNLVRTPLSTIKQLFDPFTERLVGHGVNDWIHAGITHS